MSADPSLPVLALALSSLTVPGSVVDMALGPSGTIYMLSGSDPEITVTDASGNRLHTWDLDAPPLPVSICVAEDGSFTVCHLLSEEAFRYDSRAELLEIIRTPSGTCAVAVGGADTWCYSLDEGRIYSLWPVPAPLERVPASQPADLSVSGSRAVLSSPSGTLLAGTGSWSPLPFSIACLSGGTVTGVLGDTLVRWPSREVLAAGLGSPDRIEGAPDGRILLWHSGGGEAILLE